MVHPPRSSPKVNLWRDDEGGAGPPVHPIAYIMNVAVRSKLPIH
jgi:hypothetical protein